MWNKAAEAFKFILGDVLCHKTHPKQPLVVVERMLIQTGGGIQRVLVCSALIEGVGQVTNEFTECELEVFEGDMAYQEDDR